MKKIIFIMILICSNLFSVDISNTVKGYVNSGYSKYNFDDSKQINLIRTGANVEVGSKLYNLILPYNSYIEILGGVGMYSNTYIFDNEYNDMMSKIYDLNYENLKNTTNIDDLKLLKDKDLISNKTIENRKYNNEKSMFSIGSSIFAKFAINGNIMRNKDLKFTLSVKAGFLMEISPEYLVYNKMISNISNDYYKSDLEKKEKYENKMIDLLTKEHKKSQVIPIYEISTGVKYKDFIFELYSGKIDYIGLKLGYEHEF